MDVVAMIIEFSELVRVEGMAVTDIRDVFLLLQIHGDYLAGSGRPLLLEVSAVIVMTDEGDAVSTTLPARKEGVLQRV